LAVGPHPTCKRKAIGKEIRFLDRTHKHEQGKNMENNSNQTPNNIADLNNPTLRERLEHKINNKTKPPGSLGRIETLAVQLGLILQTEIPRLTSPQMIVCAADHGIVAHGVSAFPSDVTWQMVENFLSGGAAVSVLARQHGIGLTVVDCGVKHDFAPREGLLLRKIAYGTADPLQAPAMSVAQCEQALENGRDVLRSLPGNAVLLGEMGIGNTSAASLLLARLTGLDIAICTGAGTGLDATGIDKKTDVLRRVLAHHSEVSAPLDVLACFGGFEIATLVGIVLQAALENRVIVVDGFIASSAVLVASRLAPFVLQRCVFAHRSGERGHQHMLEALQAQALLDLGLRLGEGSGAAMAWPLLQSACAIMAEMASFEDAGVSRSED
jgi:nicotinate-nucleotide--dimethylbenzimidazole phosphoribosyltransferase